MSDELKDSGTINAMTVIGLVFGLIGMMGLFVPCIGSLAFSADDSISKKIIQLDKQKVNQLAAAGKSPQEQKEKAKSLASECDRITRAKGPRAALSVCKEAVKLDPKNVLAHYNLGVALRTQYGSTTAEIARGCKEAIPEFEESILLGKDLDSHASLANCYLHGNEPRKAINLLEQGIRDFPNYPDMAFVYAQLGNAYHLLGENAKALTYYQKAKDLRYDDPLLEKQIKRLKDRLGR